MAKWGEGDPRWIVEERADATNVNNWHWTEKNATQWSKDKLKELLLNIVVEDERGCCETKEMSRIEGEATANNRKAKLIFFYEFEIELDWEGTLKNSDNKTVYKGKVTIPNLSEEHTAKDVDINITVTGESDDAYKLKELMRTKAPALIRDKLDLYIRLLRQEFTQGMILPTKSEANTTVNQTDADGSGAAKANDIRKQNAVNAAKNDKVGVKIPTTSVSMNEEFKCRVGELYMALTDENMVRAFTRGGSSMVCEAEAGGKFAFFDGNVSGQFVELVPNQQIKMEWRLRQWPEEHYSQVAIELIEKEDHTLLKLNQTGVPQNFVDNTKEGWRRFYWESIKQTFGFGARLL